jgi:hypothetical protein
VEEVERPMGSKIYKGQSALRITLKTFTDLEGIISAVNKYRKPDSSIGELSAVDLPPLGRQC